MNRLKTLRNEKYLLQSDISKIIGTSPQAYGLYENGKRDIPTEILKKLSDFFDVSIDYILGRSDIRISKNISIFNRLRILREEQQLSQEHIAKILNISRPQYSLYETGKRNIPTEFIIKLSDFFNVSTDFILGKSNIKNLGINEELLKLGFDINDYEPPTNKQKEQIKSILEIILKDNKKKR